jgi:hypothetical protein
VLLVGNQRTDDQAHKCEGGYSDNPTSQIHELHLHRRTVQADGEECKYNSVFEASNRKGGDIQYKRGCSVQGFCADEEILESEEGRKETREFKEVTAG